MTKQARKTTKTEERAAIDAALTAGSTVTLLPPVTKKQRKAAAPKPTKTPKGKKAKKSAKAESGPVKGSVIAKAWKAKAGKSGTWRDDAIRNAIKSAFLREGSDKVGPQEAARIATDTILAENHLDAGRWAGKNAGMLSMNLGNVLRAMQRNDGVVFVYGKKLAA